jgi:hypothetical protein
MKYVVSEITYQVVEKFLVLKLFWNLPVRVVKITESLGDLCCYSLTFSSGRKSLDLDGSRGYYVTLNLSFTDIEFPEVSCM